MVFQNEKRFWHIVYAYIPIALIGIFFLGWIITPSYYTLIFLGVIPFFFLLWNNKIGRGDVKGSFLYSLPLLWPIIAEFIWIISHHGTIKFPFDLTLSPSLFFDKSNAIAGQVILLGIFIALYL